MKNRISAKYRIEMLWTGDFGIKIIIIYLWLLHNLHRQVVFLLQNIVRYRLSGFFSLLHPYIQSVTATITTTTTIVYASLNRKKKLSKVKAKNLLTPTTTTEFHLRKEQKTNDYTKMKQKKKKWELSIFYDLILFL